MKKYLLCAIAALSLFVCLFSVPIKKRALQNTEKQLEEERADFAKMEIQRPEWKKSVRKKEYQKKLSVLQKEIICFPIPAEDTERVRVENNWMDERTYKGTRSHEGCDLMDEKNKRGSIPVLSMTDGKVEKMGWLELGGYRVGIRAYSGNYYYYAHLDSYSPVLEIGEKVRAGQFLGFMGDSGYGPEKTKGKFPVHLHLGIYLRDGEEEYSINPYYLLYNIK